MNRGDYTRTDFVHRLRRLPDTPPFQRSAGEVRSAQKLVHRALTAGVRWPVIVEATGVSRAPLQKLVRSGRTSVHFDVVGAVLTVDWERVRQAHRAPTPTEAATVSKRLRNLGWSNARLQRESGLSNVTISRALKSPHTMTRDTYEVLTALLDGREHPRPGSSRVRVDDAHAHVTRLLELGHSMEYVALTAKVSRDVVARVRRGEGMISGRSEQALLSVPLTGPQEQRAEDAVAHVEQLIQRGWTPYQIGIASGFRSNEPIDALLRGRRPTVATRRALLAIPLTEPPQSSVVIPADEVRRHIQVLLDAGGTDRSIANEAGVSAPIITKLRNGVQKGVSTTTASWILAVTPDRVATPIYTVGQAQDHLQVLTTDPLVTLTGIAKASGVDRRTVQRFLSAPPDQRGNRVHRVDVGALLAVTPQQAASINDRFPPEPLRDHLQMLLTSGMSMTAIADASHTTLSTISALCNGDPRIPSRRVGNAIMAVRADAHRTQHRLVSSVGVRRRLRALLAHGYSWKNLRQELPSGVETFLHDTPASSAEIRLSTARLVAEVYDRKATVFGGDTVASRSAARRGWFAPMWWDSDTIDDPQFHPDDVPGWLLAGRWATIMRLKREYGSDVITVPYLAQRMAVPPAVVDDHYLGRPYHQPRNMARLIAHNTPSILWRSYAIATAAGIPMSDMVTIGATTTRPLPHALPLLEHVWGGVLPSSGRRHIE